MTSLPYFPSTNKLVERTVQTFKKGMRWQKNGSIETCVARFLFTYHNTPHSTTSVLPAIMMFNRPLRCHLDLLKSSIKETAQGQQIKQQLHHDMYSKDRKFHINETVFVENFGHESKWLAGTIEEILRSIDIHGKVP